MASANSDKKQLSQVVGKLSHLCRANDKELDALLLRLRQRLDDPQDIAVPRDILSEMPSVLRRACANLDYGIAQLDDSFKVGVEKLQRYHKIPEDVRQQLRQLQQHEPELTHERIQRLIHLVELYQQTLNLQDKPAPNYLRPNNKLDISQQSVVDVPPATETPVTTGSHSNNKMYARICDELQRLITELDFVGEFGQRLADLRAKLLQGVAPSDLPSLCLALINLIIDGTREERKASQAFLYSLNESLNTLHEGFTLTLQDGRDIRVDKDTLTHRMRSQLNSINRSITDSEELGSLKRTLQQQLITLGEIVDRKETLERRERELENKLRDMESSLAQMRDETAEYKKRLSAAKHKLFLDSLTQVYNRAALDERLELEYKRWQRYGNPLALAIIDVDHFKQINDQFGHMAGDKALKVIARAIQQSLRDTDFIARFGGEEFVILLPSCAPEQLNAPLEKIRNAVKQIPFKFKQDKVTVSVSIGAAMFNDNDQPLDVFERADAALYRAKNNGRDKCEIA